MKLLQISDPHFGTAQAPVVKALAAFAATQKPDALLVTGDITQRATVNEFADARAFCDSLHVPVMLSLPGNHDIPLFNIFKRLLNPYGVYLDHFGPGLENLMETPDVQVIGVNTTRWWRHKNGEVSADQVERVCTQLGKATEDQLRVVVVHQPIHVLRPEDEHDRLRGWELALRQWARAGADIVMGGHIHLPYVRELSALVPGLGRRIWCVQAGTALSSRTRQGTSNSVNLLHYVANNGSSRRCELERWDYCASTAQFELRLTTPMMLDRNC